MKAVATLILIVAQWGGEGRYAHPNTMTISEDGKTVRFDLSALPAGAKVRGARLVCFREPPAADSDEAMVNVEVLAGGKRLTPGPPWYDAFDVPAGLVKGGGALTFRVKAFPGWIREKTFLEIAYAGEAARGLPAVKDVRAVHAHGQTFITWREIETVVAKDRPTWGEMSAALEGLDAERRVRYRIYRSAEPITAGNLARATRLAEVRPLSGWNVNGRSPDQAFNIMRARMLTDLDYAKTVSRNHYSIPAGAHEAVVIDRFVVPGSKDPLANGTGLYVHHPGKAGTGHYAVTVVVDGRENTAAPAAAGGVGEKPGTGRPVLQREMDMEVLFDYAGRRLQYVQWTAPPLSNLPNRYHNWSVFVPEGVSRPAPLEIVLTGNAMYRRPRWPHRTDTVLVSPHDAPGSAYYGHHESRGTLRSMREGLIQPYTWRRMLAFLEWAVEALGIDATRVTCTGDRGLSATAALHFGMRHPEVFSVVFTCKGMPTPSAFPPMKKLRSWHSRKSKTPVWHLQRVFGRKEWGLKTAVDGGEPVNVWEFLDLTPAVAAHPEVLRPMLSYGGRGGWDWAPIGKFLDALAAARQPVVSEGTWGAVTPPLVKNPGRGQFGIDVRRDRPVPVFSGHSGDYQGGRNGDGGATNHGVWWDDAGTVDRPDRFEMVVTGGGTVNVTPRRLRKFKIKPGEAIAYEVRALARYRGKDVPARSGTVTADKLGLVTVEKVLVPGRTRIILTRSGS